MSALRFIAFALVLAASPAWAADYYVAPESIPADLLSPPYAKDSEQWQADLEAVKKAQAEAGKDDRKAALSEAKQIPDLVTKILGEQLSRDRHPHLFALLDQVDENCHVIVRQAKDYWNTPRPFEADESIKSWFSKISDHTYPSGHTACSRVTAEVLGQLLPDQRVELRGRARDIAQHRVMAGVHYPHDLKGGEELALLMIGALQQSSVYQNDLKAALKDLDQ